jgi:hypothetical protein
MCVSAMILHFLIIVILIQRTNITEEFWCSIGHKFRFRPQVILCRVSVSTSTIQTIAGW